MARCLLPVPPPYSALCSEGEEAHRASEQVWAFALEPFSLLRHTGWCRGERPEAGEEGNGLGVERRHLGCRR